MGSFLAIQLTFMIATSYNQPLFVWFVVLDLDLELASVWFVVLRAKEDSFNCGCGLC